LRGFHSDILKVVIFCIDCSFVVWILAFWRIPLLPSSRLNYVRRLGCVGKLRMVLGLRRGTSNKEPIPNQWEEMDQRKRRVQGSHWFIIKTGSGVVRMYRLSRDRLLFLEEK
jgi:hypothetical protein